MKVICVNIDGISSFGNIYDDLTIGKVYESLGFLVSPPCYRLTGDNGKTLYYNSRFFVPLEEFRDKQIDKILK